MRKLGFLTLIILSGCSTLGGWADSSMDWANRTMPTYDDWFGEQQPPQTQNYYQQTPAPVPPVQTENTIQPISPEPELYYDNSERGYSFGK